MRRFLADPGACAHPGNPVIADLVYGWGNDAWSALDEFLAACIAHASAARGPILECGSGLSTILVGAVAKMRGQRHWALEHAPKWAKRVRRCLRRYKLESVVLWAPLRDYGSFCWYDPPPESMPDSFSLVVCDGPPASTKGGRSGLAEVMRERLEPGCVILLDDAARPQDLAMARRWEAELGASIQVLGTTKPYVRMTLAGVPEGHAPDREGAAVGARRVRYTV
jgi:predicted O-methyltransferase YrrM